MSQRCNHLLAGREIAIAALLALVASIGVANDSLVIPPLPSDAFTVVIIPDTQYYLGPGTKIGEHGRSMFPGMSEHPHIVAHSKISKAQPAEQISNVYL
ncbi:hypothetical protein [Novipirellula sp.]|uniref:hypothetical protein n=1 Tax=Novipirellula sp. TaxID=2795430 RepID=UPI00356429D9